MYKMYSWIQA